jgi:hypothetical protein
MLNDKNVTDAINSLQLASIVADFRIVDGALKCRLNLQYDKERKTSDGVPVRGSVVSGTIAQVEDELRKLAKSQRRSLIAEAKALKAKIQSDIDALEAIVDEEA